MGPFRAICAIVITLASFTLGLEGCKGKGTGPTAAGPTPRAGPGGPGFEEGQPGTNEPGGGQPGGEIPNPYGPLPTRQEYETLLTTMPDVAGSPFDKIRRDEIYGFITAEEAARQRMCFYCENSCLNAGYREANGSWRTSECGTSFAQMIDHDLSCFPDLRGFYESVCAQGGQPSAPPNLTRESQKALFQTAPQTPPPPGTIRVTTNDGQFSFTLMDHEVDNCYYRHINKKETITAPGGRSFDVYYTQGDEGTLADVRQVLQNSAMWSLVDQIFVPGHTSKELSGHDRPTIFLIGSTPIGMAGLAYHDFPTGRGYISVATETLIPECESPSPETTDGEPSVRADAETAGRAEESPPPSQIAFEQYLSFLRGDTAPFPTPYENKALLVHELFHLLEANWLNEKFYHPSIETLADAFVSLVYPNRPLLHHHYPFFLYTTHLPFDDRHFLPHNRPYGVSLFWTFLGCQASNQGKSATSPMHRYEHCAKGLSEQALNRSAPFRTCSEEAVKEAAGSFEEGLLAFGEAALQVPIDGVTRMKSCDSSYLPHYLPGGFGNAPLAMPDSRGISSELHAHTARPKMEYSIEELNEFSVRYDVLISSEGDTFNNYYKLNFSELLAQRGNACSALGFKIDEDDRTRYEVLFHERIPSSGIVEYTATEADKEPDVMIMTCATGRLNNGTSLSSKVTVETKPFTEPIQFNLQVATPRLCELGAFDSCSYNAPITFNGVLDTSGLPLEPATADLDYSLMDNILVPTTYYQWQMEPRSRLEGIAPFVSGDATWNVSYSSSSSLDGTTCSESCRDQDSNHPLIPSTNDTVILHIGSNTDVEGRYALNIRAGSLYDGMGGCRGPLVCTVPGLGTVRSTSTYSVYPNQNANAFGSFSDGVTSINMAGQNDWITGGRIIFSEPIESPRLIIIPGTLTGGLMWDPTQELGRQLVPPLIDFPRANDVNPVQ